MNASIINIEPVKESRDEDDELIDESGRNWDSLATCKDTQRIVNGNGRRPTTCNLFKCRLK